MNAQNRTKYIKISQSDFAHVLCPICAWVLSNLNFKYIIRYGVVRQKKQKKHTRTKGHGHHLHSKLKNTPSPPLWRSLERGPLSRRKVLQHARLPERSDFGPGLQAARTQCEDIPIPWAFFNLSVADSLFAKPTSLLKHLKQYSFFSTQGSANLELAGISPNGICMRCFFHFRGLQLESTCHIHDLSTLFEKII